MKIINVRHSGIVVSDMERSISFYRDTLGFDIVSDQMESGRYIEIFLGLDGVRVRTVKMKLEESGMIELLWFPAYPQETNHKKVYDLGCSHVALTVTSVDKIYEKLIKLGTEFVNPPHVSSDGKAKVAFCKDPDGTFLELVEELK